MNIDFEIHTSISHFFFLYNQYHSRRVVFNQMNPTKLKSSEFMAKFVPHSTWAGHINTWDTRLCLSVPRDGESWEPRSPLPSLLGPCERRAACIPLWIYFLNYFFFLCVTDGKNTRSRQMNNDLKAAGAGSLEGEIELYERVKRNWKAFPLFLWCETWHFLVAVDTCFVSFQKSAGSRPAPVSTDAHNTR